MKILIFEGIATSGKSTLIKILEKQLKAQVFWEEETNEPIMDDYSNTNLSFYKALLPKIDNESKFVIFDRLYLTQAYRASLPLNTYSEIEEALLKYSPVIIYLQVDEDAIADRVVKAAGHRPKDWGDYIKTKGSSPSEIADYYIDQQRKRLKLLEDSKLPYKIFNTTNHNYDEVAQEIIDFVKNQE